MSVRVLLVDDNPAILQTMSGILRLEGLEVATSSSAADGIKRLAQSDFELVITDMRMEAPNAGCQVVRAAAVHPARPVVIVLTAFPISANEMRAMGASTVLLKGTSPGNLVRQIRNIATAIEAHRTSHRTDARSDTAFT